MRRTAVRWHQGHIGALVALVLEPLHRQRPFKPLCNGTGNRQVEAEAIAP